MKLFFITPQYTVYILSFFFLINCSTLSAQIETTAVDLQITQTNIELTKDRVTITWASKDESELDLFIVQRSIDGKQWEQVVAIAAAGDNDIRQIYQTSDTQPYEDVSYYRIGQLDYEGEETFTEVITIENTVPMERFFSAQLQHVKQRK